VSLSFLWEKYCQGKAAFDRETKKKWQGANWSKRPLSPEMVRYAAHDSHFLLHIAQQILIDLSKKLPRETASTTIGQIHKDINEAASRVKFVPRSLRLEKWNPASE